MNVSMYVCMHACLVCMHACMVCMICSELSRYRIEQSRAVRSASRNLICERRTKTATGARAFGVAAPKVWPDLPDSIRYSDFIT